MTRLLESMSENNSAGSCKRKMQLEEEISRVAKVIAGINAKTAREGEL